MANLKKKSGVYCWTNLANNKCYVGSSSDLRRRFSWYYSLESIEEVIIISLISRALLKYGYSGFRLDILVYCNPEQLIKREQYYINTINPEYNILRIAGSSLGYKHTEESLAKIRARSISQEHREHLKKLHLSRSHKVEVFDTLSNETTVFSSAREAALSLGCVESTISKALKHLKEKGVSNLIKNRYMVKKNNWGLVKNCRVA